MTRALICGSRNYKSRGCLTIHLDNFRLTHNITKIIQGGQTGADTLADEWATKNNIFSKSYNADWTTYGKAAGPIRNRQMIREGKPNFIIAFPGGTGTQNMIAQAKFASLPVYEIKE